MIIGPPTYGLVSYQKLVPRSRILSLLARSNYSGITTLSKASLNSPVTFEGVVETCTPPTGDGITQAQTNWLTGLYYRGQKISIESDLTASDVKVVTLDNGMRMVIDETPSPFASIGVFLVAAGSANEQKDELGSTYILEKTAFNGTAKWKGSELVDKIQSLGCSIETSSSRDGLLYSTSILPNRVPELLQVLHEMIMEPPKITDQHILECKEKLKFELIQTKEKPDMLLQELVHMKMFGSVGLGNTLFNFVDGNKRDNFTTLAGFQKFRNRCTLPENICIGSIGIPADQLVPLVEKQFCVEPKATINEFANSSYHTHSGGPLYVQDQSFLHTIGLSEANPYPNHIHFMIAFPSCPSWHMEDIFPSAVGMSLLGGGSSFSSGGPGKGLYSRLYSRLLNQYGFFESAHSMMLNYANAGIFGIMGSCRTYAIENVLYLVIRELFDMSNFSTSSGSKRLSYALGTSSLEKTRFDGDVELARAKNQIKGNLLMGLEPLSARLENNIRNAVLMNGVLSKEALVKKLDQVSMADLSRVRNRVLGLIPNDSQEQSDRSKPLPTVVAVGGDLSSMPSYSTILGMIEEHNTRICRTK